MSFFLETPEGIEVEVSQIGTQTYVRVLVDGGYDEVDERDGGVDLYVTDAARIVGVGFLIGDESTARDALARYEQERTAQ